MRISSREPHSKRAAVYIEYCQARYDQLFSLLQAEIATACPKLHVLGNKLPPTSQLPPQVFATGLGLASFPRVGAFEVYYRGVLVFSKLQTRAWPDIPRLLQTLKRLSRQKKSRSSLRTGKRQASQKSQITLKSKSAKTALAPILPKPAQGSFSRFSTSSTNLSRFNTSSSKRTLAISTDPQPVKIVSRPFTARIYSVQAQQSLTVLPTVSQAVLQPFQENQAETHELPRSVERPVPKLTEEQPIQRFAEKTPVYNKGDRYSVEEQKNVEPSEEQPAQLPQESEESKHPISAVTKTVELLLPLGKAVSKKITYPNSTSRDGTFTLESSHPASMVVTSPELVLSAGKKGRFAMMFPGRDEPAEATYYLYIRCEGALLDCYEVKASYANS